MDTYNRILKLNARLLLLSGIGCSHVKNKTLSINNNLLHTTTDTSSPVVKAYTYKTNDITEWILDNEANVNKILTNGSTLLNEVIKNRDMVAAQLLLDKGAKVDKLSSMGTLPLNEAIQTRDTRIIQLLLNHGAKVNVASSEISPLFQAISIQDRDIVQLLLNHGAKVNLPPPEISPLFQAISIQDRDIVQLLLNYGADINAIPGKDNGFSFARSTYPSRIDICDLLFVAQLSLDASNLDKHESEQHKDCTRFLMKAIYDKDEDDYDISAAMLLRIRPIVRDSIVNNIGNNPSVYKLINCYQLLASISLRLGQIRDYLFSEYMYYTLCMQHKHKMDMSRFGLFRDLFQCLLEQGNGRHTEIISVLDALEELLKSPTRDEVNTLKMKALRAIQPSLFLQTIDELSSMDRFELNADLSTKIQKFVPKLFINHAAQPIDFCKCM